jgi:chemotaxis protein methyltransferase CheR
MKHAEAEQFLPFPGVSAQIYGKKDFTDIREMIYARAGIVLPPGKSTLVYSRLAPLVRASNSGTFAAYIQRIKTDQAECRKAVSALTTNHTFFYREPHHFEFVRDRLRSGLIQRLVARQPVRIWSAGASSGEEVYSLVMTLLGPDRAEARPFFSGDLAILASDLADHAVAKGSAAVYEREAIDPMPVPLHSLWAKVDKETASIVDVARDLVRWRSLNLLGDWPFSRQFDIIFCRNVMIYFDQQTREKLINRFVDQLAVGGHLFIGHSERVTGPAEARLKLVGMTTYERVK